MQLSYSNLTVTKVGGVGGGRLFVFDWEGEGGGVGWALINFFSLCDGRLFDLGANSRLSASSNKYGMLEPSVVEEEVILILCTFRFQGLSKLSQHLLITVIVITLHSRQIVSIGNIVLQFLVPVVLI